MAWFLAAMMALLWTAEDELIPYLGIFTIHPCIFQTIILAKVVEGWGWETLDPIPGATGSMEGVHPRKGQKGNLKKFLK